jgi:hypothetical protein
MTFFEITPEGLDPVDTQTAVDQHHFAMIVLAAFAIAALGVAIYYGSKPAAIGVAVMGAIALLLFLTIDLPDANSVGAYNTFGDFLPEAKAVPQAGFWLCLIGSLSLTISGLALATLSPERLSALRPRRRQRQPKEPTSESPST